MITDSKLILCPTYYKKVSGNGNFFLVGCEYQTSQLKRSMVITRSNTKHRRPRTPFWGLPEDSDMN